MQPSTLLDDPRLIAYTGDAETHLPNLAPLRRGLFLWVGVWVASQRGPQRHTNKGQMARVRRMASPPNPTGAY